MNRRIVPYRSDLTERARELRHKMMLAEVLLWKRLKGKQLCGYDFDRQKPLVSRIVDFYCKELCLAVDLDGSVHDHTREKDEQRHREIVAMGITHLRFWNFFVKNDISSVLKTIEENIRVEEKRRGLPKREPPVKVMRSRATRSRKSGHPTLSHEPAANPSVGGEHASDIQQQNQPSNTLQRPIQSSPPGRAFAERCNLDFVPSGQGWVRP